MSLRLKVPTIATQCPSCGHEHLIPDQAFFPYATILFSSENGSTFRACEALCNPVWELVETMVPEQYHTLVAEVVARLADQCEGQELRSARICPNCRTPTWKQWSDGDNRGEAEIQFATFKQFLRFSRARQRKVAQLVVDELGSPTLESHWCDWLGFVSMLQHRRYVTRSVKDDAARKAAMQALGRFPKLYRSNRITRDSLLPIATAVESRFKPVWSIGGEMLLILAARNRVAQEMILELGDSPRTETRFHVVATAKLHFGTPRPVIIELLTRRINDKGTKVRQFALDAVGRCRLNELAIRIEERMKVEPHPVILREIDFHLAMLKDGYRLEVRDDGSPDLTIRTISGYSCPRFTRADLDAGRLQEVIAKVHRDEERLFPEAARRKRLTSQNTKVAAK